MTTEVPCLPVGLLEGARNGVSGLQAIFLVYRTTWLPHS